jgi:hypothetical protein
LALRSPLTSDDICPRAQKCVLSAIQVALAYLSSSGVDDEAKLAALKSAWDTCLVLKAVGEDVGEAATELMKTITPARNTAFVRARRVSIHRGK